MFSSPNYNYPHEINPPVDGFNFINGVIAGSQATSGQPLYGESMRTEAVLVEGGNYLVSFYKGSQSSQQEGVAPVSFEIGFTNDDVLFYGDGSLSLTQNFIQNVPHQAIFSQLDITSDWEKVVLCVQADAAYNQLYSFPFYSNQSIDGIINDDFKSFNGFLLSRVDAIRDVFPQEETKSYDCDATAPVELGAELCQEMDGLEYSWEFTTNVEEVNGQFQVTQNAVWNSYTINQVPVVSPLINVTPIITSAYRLNRSFAQPPNGINLITVDSPDCTVNRSAEFIVVVPENCCPDQSTINMGLSNLSDGDQLCFGTNDLPIPLNPNTPGGVFSGVGVSGATFNPASTGTYTITYTLANIPEGCDYMESIEVEVVDAPNANFTLSNTQTCLQAISLTPIEGGGVWSGTNVSTNGIFNPNGLNPGTYTVTYTIDNGICPAISTNQIITVVPIPDASFNVNNPMANTYCSDDDRVALIPVTQGGTFTGFGGGLVEENGQWFFDPALVDPAFWGSLIGIRYNLDEGPGCFIWESANFTVFPSPDASFTGFNTAQFYCEDESNVTLNGAGTFTGNGISGNTFSPTLAGVGTHTITHTVVGIAGCDGVEIVEVQVGHCCVNTIEIENREQLDCCLEEEDTNDNLIDLTDTAEGVFAQGDNFRYVVQGILGGFSENWTNNNNELETVFGNFSGAVKLNVDLVIPNGVDLSISNMELQFGPEGRIIVERGGVLTLTDGAELSGLCNSMWQGIQVYEPGYYNDYTSGFTNSGVLHFDKSIKTAPDLVLENAIIGVVNRKVPLFDMESLSNQIAYLGDLVAIGQINQIPTAILPNLTDIKFSGGAVYLGGGLINKCFYGAAIGGYGGDTEFIADSTRVLGINHLRYPLQDFGSEIGIMLRFTPFDNHKIQNGCIFSSLTHGIYSEMSGVKKIDSIYFGNCVRGITEANFIDNQLTTIDGCNFSNCLLGIQATGSELLIDGNDINSGNLVYGADIGMLLRACDFTVQDYNDLDNLYYGIVVLDSYKTVNNIKRNNLNDTYIGILSGGVNAQLEIRCNNFEDYLQTGIGVVPWEGIEFSQSWLGDQGNCQDSQEPAANDFQTMSTQLFGGDKDIWTSIGSESFDYFDVPSVLATIEASDIVTEKECPTTNYDPVTYCKNVKILTIQEIQALPTEKLKNKELANLYFSYKNNNQEAAAITALEQINTPYAQRKLIPYKIQNREFSVAQQLLDGLATISLEEQHFVTYHKILLNIAQSSRKPTDINVFEKALLFDMAQHRTKTAYKAQTLLHVARGMYFPVAIPEFTPPSSGGGHKQSIEIASQSLVSLIHPNPISSVSYLKYNLGTSETAQLHIFNLYGQKIYSKILKGNSSIMIEAKNFENGMYLYVVEQKGTILLKEKIFVVK